MCCWFISNHVGTYVDLDSRKRWDLNIQQCGQTFSGPGHTDPFYTLFVTSILTHSQVLHYFRIYLVKTARMRQKKSKQGLFLVLFNIVCLFLIFQTKCVPAHTVNCSTQSSWSQARKMPPTTTLEVTTPLERKLSMLFWTESVSCLTSAQVRIEENILCLCCPTLTKKSLYLDSPN